MKLKILLLLFGFHDDGHQQGRSSKYFPRSSMGAVASVVSGLAGEVLRPRHAPSAGPRDQDADLVFRPGLTVAQLLDSCAAHLDSAKLPPPLPRSWSPSFPPHTSPPPGTDTTGDTALPRVPR